MEKEKEKRWLDQVRRFRVSVRALQSEWGINNPWPGDNSRFRLTINPDDFPVNSLPFPGKLELGNCNPTASDVTSMMICQMQERICRTL
jgi:hypothetical protein